MGLFSSVSHAVSTAVKQVTSAVEQTGQAAGRISRSPTTTKVLPAASWFTTAGRANLATTYGPIVRPVANVLTGGKSDAIGGMFSGFLPSGAAAGLFPELQPQPSASSDGGGSGGGGGMFASPNSPAAGMPGWVWAVGAVVIAGGLALILVRKGR